jgi:hypothetical protein
VTDRKPGPRHEPWILERRLPMGRRLRVWSHRSGVAHAGSTRLEIPFATPRSGSRTDPFGPQMPDPHAALLADPPPSDQLSRKCSSSLASRTRSWAVIGQNSLQIAQHASIGRLPLRRLRRAPGLYPSCERLSLHVGHVDIKGLDSKNKPSRAGQGLGPATARGIIFAVILAPLTSLTIAERP